jgi:hypothetical protein
MKYKIKLPTYLLIFNNYLYFKDILRTILVDFLVFLYHFMHVVKGD